MSTQEMLDDDVEESTEKTRAQSTIFNERWAQETDFIGKLAVLENKYWDSVFGAFSEIGQIDGADSSPVFKAIEFHEIDFLRRHFSDPSADTEITLNGTPGLTPLVFACFLSEPQVADYESTNELDIIKLLISNGAEVNSRCETNGLPVIGVSNVTALYIAIKNQNIPLIHLLLDNGADPRVQMSPHKITPLHQAAYNNFPLICGRLLELGADINAQDVDGNTPLVIACAARNSGATKLLMRKKADVNIPSKRNVTALHAAIFGGSAEIVRLLLRSGSKVNVKTIEGHSPLDMAVFLRKNKLKKLIIEAKGRGSLKKRSRAPKPLQSFLVPRFGGMTALHIAAMNNYIDDVKYFLDHGDIVNDTDGEGQTPLFFAVMGGSVEIVELLLKSNAGPNFVNLQGMTPLHLAALDGLIQITQTLLDNGARVDIPPHMKMRPFLISAAAATQLPISDIIKLRKLKIAEMLIKRGAAIDETFEGCSPLDHAAHTENHPLETVLKRQMQLFQFIESNNLTELKKCIASGAILDCRSVQYGTPLQYAAVRNSLDIVTTLIESGADVNYAPAGNSTALHYAAKFNNTNVVRHLLMNGAAFDVRTSKSGKTPLNICLGNNTDDCETAVLLKTVEVMFEQMSVGDIDASNENRDLVEKVRNCKGQSVDDVRRAKD